MASNLNKIKGKVAFLCGDIHASKKEIKLGYFAWVFWLVNLMKLKLTPVNTVLHPCGSYLPHRTTVSIRIVAKKGKYYNFEEKKYNQPKQYESVKRLNELVKSPDENYDFAYVIELFTPSI